MPAIDHGVGACCQDCGGVAKSIRIVNFNAMVVDIHGVHHETVPGSAPEGMQLLRLGEFPRFGAPCISCYVFVLRPSEATGLLVTVAGAYTR